MLRTTLCCLLIAATSPVGAWWDWQTLQNTPDVCEVSNHSRLTYGNGSIWGVFPNYVQVEQGKTFVAHYDPLSTDPASPPTGTWKTPIEIPGAPYLYGTGITFQWDRGSALYVVGSPNGDATKTTLYWYTPGNSVWHEYVDERFSLGSGACIVFVPNRSFTTLNQVAGYIYCLHGNNDKGFLYYSIEPSTYTAVQGIFPPDGSTIPDQTPKFEWVPWSGNHYRLQVSTDDLFSTTVIDEEVFAAEYQTTSNLVSDTFDTFYWRVGTPDSLDWTWGNAHSFVLLGGWMGRRDIPENVQNGAALAYEGDQWCWQGAQSIIATVGGGSTKFYRYDVEFNTWTRMDDSPEQWPGTSLTTNDPTQEFGEWPAAVFGGQTTDDFPWTYNVRDNLWSEWTIQQFNNFPEGIGPGACFVGGPRPWAYLTTGTAAGRWPHHFWAIEPKHIKSEHEGSQAGYVYAGGTRARVITSYDRVEVEYQLPAAAHVRASLHDAVGRQVGVADAGIQQSGTHRLSWIHTQEGRRLGAGAYFVLLDMGSGQVCLKSIVK
jgi:hypothetical protein